MLIHQRSGARVVNTPCLPPAEILLWERLQDDQSLGAQFKRDSKIGGNHFADFACPDLRIAILLDRAGLDRSAKGAKLDAVISRNGYINVSVESSEVYDNLDAVYARIATAVDLRMNEKEARRKAA